MNNFHRIISWPATIYLLFFNAKFVNYKWDSAKIIEAWHEEAASQGFS